MSLKAHEHALKKIFSSDFDFVIPHYQRPYAWGTEQAGQLLDDLTAALDTGSDEPYFLGSLVLVKPEDDRSHSQVIDGQQRLTTLSILLAVVRDLATDPQTATTLGQMVLEPGEPLDGILPKPRLQLRPQDDEFFRKHVQDPGQVDHLLQVPDHGTATDSQRAIRDNARALRAELSTWPEDRRAALAGLLRTRTFLVVVTTPNLHSAHRIFSVMNARGLDLEPSDIFKSEVIGRVAEQEQKAYADKWEAAELDLGRGQFADLFLHLRMIVSKVRGQRELLLEFPEQVLAPYLATGAAKEFVDGVLLPHASAYSRLLKQNFDAHDPQWRQVNNWLRRLVQLDNNDWRPPALWALRSHADDPVFLAEFLRRLERLAASMLLRRVYATPRVLRYAELLKQVDGGGHGWDAPAFNLDDDERTLTRERLGEKIYLVQPVRKYVLLRLDEIRANQPGVSYEHKIISVEHVLPQTPAVDSAWLAAFDEDEREYWTHRLGNLLLLNRTKNSEAQNYDFAKKKEKYFTTKNGAAMFALTTEVVAKTEWTPHVVARRHREMLDVLTSAWELA